MAAGIGDAQYNKLVQQYGKSTVDDYLNKYSITRTGGSSGGSTGSTGSTGGSTTPSEPVPEAPPGNGSGGGSVFRKFLSGATNNETIRSLFFWQILGALSTPVMAPFSQILSNRMFGQFPVVPLAPADAADAVVRGFMTNEQGQIWARKSGTQPELFDTMVQLSGDAPSPTDLVTALRRGIIPEDSGDAATPGFVQGIREGRLADKWTDMIKGLAQEWPTPTDALQAYLEGQVDETNAKALYQKFGGDLDYFQLLYNTRGNAPTPMEATQMANRGVIPWTGTGAGVVSYEQAFLEGPWRNKWSKPYRALAERLPTAPEIRSMYHQGTIDSQKALGLMAELGMRPDIAALFLKEASSTKLASSKNLAKTTVEKLYVDQVIVKQDALNMLKTLGYSVAEADYIIQVQDLARAEKALGQALSKIHTLYVDHKITGNEARSALNVLQIPSTQINDMFSSWDLEAGANIRKLTESQIADAYHYQIIKQDEAQQLLQSIGYQPHDAWMILSVKSKAPLPGEPAQSTTLPFQEQTTGG